MKNLAFEQGKDHVSVENLQREKRKKKINLKDTVYTKESEDYYDLKQMKEMIIGLNEDERALKKLGYDWIDIDKEANPLISYDKKTYALGVTVQNSHDASQQKGWITLNIDDENNSYYFDNISGQVIQKVETPPQIDARDWLESASRETKVVKSRPMWMYPQLFDLPHEEVWPEEGKVMVIGDPFQACDRDDCTIVEYEYSDEMLPPVLPYVLGIKKDLEKMQNDVSYWLEELYHEDLMSFDRMYGFHTPEEDNPYKGFMYECYELTAEISRAMLAGENLDELKDDFEQIKKLGKKFINGSWNFEDANYVLHYDDDKEISEDLRNFFNYKQDVLEQLGNPEAWEDFVSSWTKYLDKLPNEELRGKIEDYDKKIEQAKHWLKVLPTATSAHRVNDARFYLENLLSEIKANYNENNNIVKTEDGRIRLKIRDSFSLETAFDKEWGFFGFFIPGHPISLRQKKALEEGMYRVEQILNYQKVLFKNIDQENKRLEKEGIPLNDGARYQYFNQLQQAWARQHFFQKRTKKSVAIHGFFPYEMPKIEEQDRIVALTSVTMHGWNHLSQENFQKDIEAALPYLKIGGKYILGPVNQSVYFGHANDGFDADALTAVLQELKSRGDIEYEFVKGTRDYSYGSDDDYYEEGIEFDPDNQVLHYNEAAASLVITRLK